MWENNSRDASTTLETQQYIFKATFKKKNKAVGSEIQKDQNILPTDTNLNNCCCTAKSRFAHILRAKRVKNGRNRREIQ